MLDLKMIRADLENVRTALADKGARVDLDALVALDQERRRVIGEVEELKQQRNLASRQIAEARKQGQEAAEAIARTREVADQIKQLDAGLGDIERQLEAALLMVPNLPAPQAPRGLSAEQNVVRQVWGEAPRFDFPLRDHVELGTALELIDFEAGASLSGSGFVVFTGWGARLVRALMNFMIDHHTSLNGYREVWPPVLVRAAAMTGTGQLPKMADDMYRLERDELYLVPTAEVPVTNLHADQILDEKTLPIGYVAYSPCFRREAGAHGADTRGLVRLHQFDKVELVRFTTPEQGEAEHERLLEHALGILQRLGLHYRIVELCAGDLSFAARRCWDLEVWSPGIERWLEVSSCSHFGDFQARRASIRYRRADDGRVEHVHTLNASGVAFPRLIAALLETGQTDEGSVQIPEALRPYLGGRARFSAPDRD